MLRYQYSIGPDCSFDFNTLAEVGELYQPWFLEKIAKMGWVVEWGVPLAEYPWVADFVIRKLK